MSIFQALLFSKTVTLLGVDTNYVSHAFSHIYQNYNSWHISMTKCQVRISLWLQLCKVHFFPDTTYQNTSWCSYLKMESIIIKLFTSTFKLYKYILIFQKYIWNDSFLTIFPYLSMPNSIISLDHNQDISVIGDSFMIQNVT